MLLASLTFLGGLAGLLVAGHVLVSSASSIGRRFGLTPMVVGLTIVAAGTSAPELAVVGQSVAAGDSELAVGSIIGSNIANVLLVLGLAAVLGAVRVNSRVVRVDIPVMIAASFALLWMAQDKTLGRIDGIVMVIVMVGFVGWTLSVTRGQNVTAAPDALTDRGMAPEQRPSPAVWRSIIALALGIGGLAIAARYVVQGAEEIAVLMGVPELIVGLTIVAVGTSAPEIVTTVIAALNGQRDLAVGNAVGSNIFNILFVLGASATFSSNGIAFGGNAIEVDLPIMLAVAVACLLVVAFNNAIARWQGAMFLGYYAAYIVFLVLDAMQHQAKGPFVFVVFTIITPLAVAILAMTTIRERRLLRTVVADPDSARPSNPAGGDDALAGVGRKTGAT